MKQNQPWNKQVIKQDEIDKYHINNKHFIDDTKIRNDLKNTPNITDKKIKDILKKSLSIQRLEPEEVAILLNVKDKKIWEELYATADIVKKKVYDNRIVFFAPLYLSDKCVNNCNYCGFKTDNVLKTRKILSDEEIQKEVAVIVSEGHKRVIAVYGEHPESAIDYITHSMKQIYSVNHKNNNDIKGEIRRINVNAAPMSIADLTKLKKAGIGTYQVFQETYHQETYGKVHPQNTIKGNYEWRLYALHRAMDAGIDDFSLGVLFGLYDWRYEIMGLLYHAIDLENRFGIGPHTISFPRLKEAYGADLSKNKYLVSDDDLKKIITILRLAVPYTGLIITAREEAAFKKECINLGCTQTDASTRIDIGGYNQIAKEWENQANQINQQDNKKQQFNLGDTRRIDAVIGELATMGIISSFCTAGYRCGRTGDKIMRLLCTGVEGKYCKLNAILTFKEYLEDYASENTKKIGEELILKEIEETKKSEWYSSHKKILEEFYNLYKRIENGERDLYI